MYESLFFTLTVILKRPKGCMYGPESADVATTLASPRATVVHFSHVGVLKWLQASHHPIGLGHHLLQDWKSSLIELKIFTYKSTNNNKEYDIDMNRIGF